MKDLDEVFPAYWIEYQFPLLFKVFCLVPHQGLRHFLTAGHRFYKVISSSFTP